MKHLKKSAIIAIVASLLVVSGLVTTAIILTNKTDGEASFNATVVNLSDAQEKVKDSIIEWDSSTKEHPIMVLKDDVVCTVSAESAEESIYIYETYTDFQTGWVAANTTYKNVANLVFTFYADWVVDVENWGPGVFGHDEHEEGTTSIGEIAFIDAIGGLLLKGWTKDFTIDFNGYKIDGKCEGKSRENGSVIKIDECKNVYLQNGCITGGATDTKGGGLLVYGETRVYLENMTITGNYAGTYGGGIYFGDHVSVSTRMTDTVIEGNYTAGYGGGVYCAHDSSKFDVMINLYGTVKIQNNIGRDDRDNMTFEGEYDSDSCSHVGYVELSEGSSVYLSLSCLDSSTKAIVDSGAYSTKYDQYFHADGDDWRIYSDCINNSTFLGTGLSRYALLIAKKNKC